MTSELDKLLDTEHVSDENITKIIGELLNTQENLEAKSELNSNQIIVITRAKIYAERYKIDVLHNFIAWLLKYLVSKDRQGRKELVEALVGAWKTEMEKARLQKVEL